MPNHFRTGSQDNVSKSKTSSTTVKQGRRYEYGASSRKITFNDPLKAKEYFALKDKYIMGPQELHFLLQEQPDLIHIVDVRQMEDYAKGHLPGAINLPQEQWKIGSGLKKDKINVIYCYNLECPLAAKAATEFATKGYSVMELVGGFKSWQDGNYEIERQVHH